MKFAIFVYQLILGRSLPGAWVAELLGVFLGDQNHKKDKIYTASILVIGSKALRSFYKGPEILETASYIINIL